jgi:hypothetical protein
VCISDKDKERREKRKAAALLLQAPAAKAGKK